MLQDLQKTHSVLVAREQALVEQQSRLSVQLSAEQKAHQQSQKEASGQHKSDIGKLKEEHSKQVAQLEAANEEHKKKLQQLTVQVRFC